VEILEISISFFSIVIVLTSVLSFCSVFKVSFPSSDCDFINSFSWSFLLLLDDSEDSEDELSDLSSLAEVSFSFSSASSLISVLGNNSFSFLSFFSLFPSGNCNPSFLFFSSDFFFCDSSSSINLLSIEDCVLTSESSLYMVEKEIFPLLQPTRLYQAASLSVSFIASFRDNVYDPRKFSLPKSSSYTSIIT